MSDIIYCKKVKIEDKEYSTPKVILGLVETFDDWITVTTTKRKYKYHVSRIIEIQNTNIEFKSGE